MNQHFESWLAEKRSAFLYLKVAQSEQGTPRQKLFQRLALEAEHQAEIWADKMRSENQPVPHDLHLDMRTRIVAQLIARLGPRAIKPILASMKIRGLSVYTQSLLSHPAPTSMEEIGRRHQRRDSGGNLRAAVFGVNDGLVSNAALISGMTAAASQDPHVVILAGTAGLLAGAFSMAAGEYVSVRSQREMFEYQIGLEAEELRLYPEEEAAELALIFEARGMEHAQAKQMASNLIKDPARALDTLAREELGLDPSELGSPRHAALYSFISFAMGAFVPLLPFFLMPMQSAFAWAIGLTGISLMTIGAILSLFTGRSAVLGGLRMLGIGGTAGILTYWIGSLLS